MQPVASPVTTTCARAAPLTPALRALRLVHVSPSSRHSPRGPALTAGILLWRARACQGNSTVARLGCNPKRDFRWLLPPAPPPYGPQTPPNSPPRYHPPAPPLRK